MESGKGLIKIIYDSSLISFVISLFWRVAITSNLTDIKPFNIIKIRNLEQIWSDFLNGKRKDWGNCEFHLILLDKIEGKDIEQFPSYLNTYVLRLWEYSVYETNNMLGFYIKLPGMILICAITPTTLPGLLETRIEYSGTMNFNKQKDYTNMVGLILLGRSIALEREISKITPMNQKKIEETIIINLNRILSNWEKAPKAK